MARAAKTTATNGNGTALNFEAKLWTTADKLRNNMDVAEYKHVVLGLIFLKYISDAFQERHQQLERLANDPQSDYYIEEQSARSVVTEDRDEYTAENIFWVPVEARWSFLQGKARQPEIGSLIDDAMTAIERDNPKLKGVLPKDYARPALDKRSLGELIDVIGTIGLGDEASRSQDILGRVYEYFLSMFASAEGLKLESRDNRLRLADVADREALLRIIQSIPSPRAEPFKVWLAQVGEERLVEIEQPETAFERICQCYRNRGYDTFKRLQELGALVLDAEETQAAQGEVYRLSQYGHQLWADHCRIAGSPRYDPGIAA